ncbi:MAG TPA: choice-of-anchor V domain-containing protein, partial [Saprospiraceae bacterium]|nr:choice-of-anchor V domain-containing protein [Saprospiraceae bacterium]
MNRNALLLSTALIGLIFLLGGAMPEPRNPPTANTGAPGETSCMLSNCHVGGSFTGTVSLSGLPDTVLADQSYEITLFNRSNSVRSGFQMTVLDATNKFTGAFTGNAEVNVARDNGNSRTYARHALAKFLFNGEASWKFNWKAPASVLNDSMVFYFSSMCGNGDGNRTGDNSIKSSKRVIFKLPSASDDLLAETRTISAYYSKGAI